MCAYAYLCTYIETYRNMYTDIELDATHKVRVHVCVSVSVCVCVCTHVHKHRCIQVYLNRYGPRCHTESVCVFAFA